MILREIKNLGFNPNNILDVGANKTEWTRECERVFPESQYYLIEPQIEMLDYLESARLELDCFYTICAAGEKDGKGLLTLWEDRCGSSLLPEIAYRFEDGTPAEQREVDVFTLDTLIKNNKIKKPDLIKIDTQGYEINVLKGLSTISDVEIIILEVSFFD